MSRSVHLRLIFYTLLKIQPPMQDFKGMFFYSYLQLQPSGDTRIPLPRKSLGHPKHFYCKVGLCTSLQTVAEFLSQYSAYVLQIQRQSAVLNKSNFAIGGLTNQQTISPASNSKKSVLS